MKPKGQAQAGAGRALRKPGAMGTEGWGARAEVRSRAVPGDGLQRGREAKPALAGQRPWDLGGSRHWHPSPPPRDHWGCSAVSLKVLIELETNSCLFWG